MFNSRICLAEETSFKKLLDEIDVLNKLILYSDVKYRSGTVKYMLPVSAKSNCSCEVLLKSIFFHEILIATK